MPKLKFELDFASLIPELLYQFLSAAHVDKESITCLEFEDLKDAVKNAKEPELSGIRQFLSVEEDTLRKSEEENLAHEEKLEKMADDLDAEIAEVDDELYHRYTPGELKYMFGEIVDNIELIYPMYKTYADVNLSLSVGFKLKSGLESGIVIEFLSIGENPEFLEDVFFIPMKNYLVSDDIVARAYLVYEKDKESQYIAEFEEIAAILQMKPGKGTAGHVHGPDCGHVH